MAKSKGGITNEKSSDEAIPQSESNKYLTDSSDEESGSEKSKDEPGQTVHSSDLETEHFDLEGVRGSKGEKKKRRLFQMLETAQQDKLKKNIMTSFATLMNQRDIHET